MSYAAVQWLHVLSSTLFFGAGIGSAYHLLLASQTRDARAVFAVVRCVVLADWLFTATTVVLQPLTGWYLARLAGWPLGTPWIFWSLVLYAVAVACWLPVVGLQLRMREIARAAVLADGPLPPRYWRCLKLWAGLGVPALLALMAVFYLMVAKPG